MRENNNKLKKAERFRSHEHFESMSIDWLCYEGIIRLPKFTSKILLNLPLYSIFYLRLGKIKFCHIPVTILAMVHAPWWVTSDSRPSIDLKVTFGTKRNKLMDISIMRWMPPPEYLKDSKFRKAIRRVIGFTKKIDFEKQTCE